MGKVKPVVIVTRKLPDVVETRMRELFDARLNTDDKPMSPAELVIVPSKLSSGESSSNFISGVR